ncbi:MAG: hypothetical protein FJ109_19000 [Deltaproteobacteria bacterium]|nr:hypothetical protein [Deltaproteobacteria bacterium]
MAKYEQLPIYRLSLELTVFLEKTVRNFSRYKIEEVNIALAVAKELQAFANHNSSQQAGWSAAAHRIRPEDSPRRFRRYVRSCERESNCQGRGVRADCHATP